MSKLTRVHEYRVLMTCEGCSTAVRRVLEKNMKIGIQDIYIDLDAQLVRVTCTCSPFEVLELIKKTGKTVEFIKST